ncbi:hypothetical protein [Trebonia sp.]|uniref:hypothetical protein n=1 Tax=Trebonia sp. TaxID=2767075 RepID=UPI002634F8CA|nr:hypothetical protein [Trebonia sp.]
MSSQPAEPEECLRSLTAEALRVARPGHPLLAQSLGVMATANAFVMLGLVAEQRAEQILAGHRAALEAKGITALWGVSQGELTVRPGAHGYWTARVAGADETGEVPLRVLPAGVRLPVTLADQQSEISIDWLKLTRTGWRMTVRTTAVAIPSADETPRAAPARQPIAAHSTGLLAQLSVTDDAGRGYELTGAAGLSRSGPGRYEWHGEAVARPDVAGDAGIAGSIPQWLEFSSAAGGDPRRVPVTPTTDIPTGVAEPRWPAPAEAFVETLAKVSGFTLNGNELTPEQTARIAATVADCLMSVGALPASSRLLREPPEPPSHGPAWQAELARRWERRIHRRDTQFRPSEHSGLVAELPLKHATAVIESVSAHGELAGIRLYGHPWVRGEYWPMITPCFSVHATGDDGAGYQGMPGNWRGSGSHEGVGEFWFWPPVPRSCQRLRVTVSTLWEAAWADINLPGRTE